MPKPKSKEVEQTKMCTICCVARPESEIVKTGSPRKVRCKIDLREQYSDLSDSEFETQVWDTLRTGPVPRRIKPEPGTEMDLAAAGYREPTRNRYGMVIE